MINSGIVCQKSAEINLINVHIGEAAPPEYAYDCIYSVMKLNKGIHLYFITNHAEIAQNHINRLDIDNADCITVMDYTPGTCEIPDKPYKDHLAKFNLSTFRDSFWISTTLRFFLVEYVMRTLNLENAFHIENDVLMLIPFEVIINKLAKPNLCQSIFGVYMPTDSPNRVVPSLMYFTSHYAATKLCKHITEVSCNSDTFKNDMEILATYPDLIPWPYDPTDTSDIERQIKSVAKSVIPFNPKLSDYFT